MVGKNYAHGAEGQWEGGERKGAQIESSGWGFRGDCAPTTGETIQRRGRRRGARDSSSRGGKMEVERER